MSTTPESALQSDEVQSDQVQSDQVQSDQVQSDQVQSGATGDGTSGTAVAIGWVFTIAVNILLPWLTFELLNERIGAVPALLASGIWPVLETVGSLVVRRHLDDFSIMVLIFLGITLLSMVAFNSPRLIMLKDSATTGLFGIVLLASLAAPRPLMFYFGRRFATNGTPEAVGRWNALWQYPGFRRSQRVVTSVWGAAMLGEALLKVVLVALLPVDALVLLFNVLPMALIAVLITWTVSYGKRQRAGRPA